MRYRWLVLMLLISFLVIAPSAQADIITVSYFEEVDTGLTLDTDSVERLGRLQDTVFSALISEVSPDDTTILTGVARQDEGGLRFLNINDGTVTPVGNVLDEVVPLSNVAWRDNDHAVFVGFDQAFDPALVWLDRNTGEYTTTHQELPGFPVSLSPNGTRLLIAIEEEIDNGEEDAENEEAPDGMLRAQSWLTSPFNRVIRLTPEPVEHNRLDAFDTSRHNLALSTEQIVLYVLDLNSQAMTQLMTLPEGSGLASPPAWTSDGSKLALVRTSIGDLERGATYLSDMIIQDTLGNLPPQENPFFQGNVVDVFDLATDNLRPEAIRAVDGSGETFLRALWSPDGQTLLTQMQHPSLLAGRTHPVYLYPDRVSFRFYNAEMQQMSRFDASEVAAPNISFPMFVSPDEVIFHAVYGLSHRLYYYNLFSQEFRQVSLWDGTYLQVRPTHMSRQLIYTFSSYQHPPEIYRIAWDGSALAALTYHNIELEAENQIRVDEVSFTLDDGTTRNGYLLQPAGATFPPQNVPIVLWQQGGPGGATTSQWGVNVENPFNLLPNFGIALLVVPLSGREGYGPDFYNALAQERNFGAVDIDEGAQIVQQMIARGYTTAEQVGITGCSYGGYFTSQSITRYPDLYAAANTQCSLLDLFFEWQFGSTWYISYLMGRAPTADASEYVADSPAYNASQVQTPLLIFHGSDDFLPVTIAANYHDQVQANGTPVEMLLFEGEGHGLEDPANQLVAGQAQIVWFQRYLSETPPENSDAALPPDQQPEPDPAPEPGSATQKPALNVTEHERASQSSIILEQTTPLLQPATTPPLTGADQTAPQPDQSSPGTSSDTGTSPDANASRIQELVRSHIEVLQEQFYP